MIKRAVTAACVLAMTGCAGVEGDDDSTGSVSMAVTVVPAGVTCVRLLVNGVARDFPGLVAGASTVLSLGQLTPGSVVVAPSAFGGACGVGTASWIGDSVTVTVVPGIVSSINLTLRPNITTNATVDFAVPAVAIAVGAGASFALMQDGTVRAWGYNGSGQLGDGTIAMHYRPAPVFGITTATQIAASAGSDHACALLADGTARCWGSNASGQIGVAGSSYYAVPMTVPVPAGTTFTQISVGTQHTCALANDGYVWCWGNNGSGRLGDGTTVNRSAPTRIITPYSPMIDVRAGDASTCARASNGSLWCWGANASGQFGTGTTVSSLTPVVTPFNPVVGVSLGANVACALYPTGLVSCAGSNAQGALGDGTVTNRLVPTPVTGLSNVVSLSTGDGHACAARADGSVSCWGNNSLGELGDGTVTNRLAPVAVPGLGGVTSVAAGIGFSCARKGDGSVWCWGLNGNGQLGDGTSTYRFVPSRVAL